MAQNVTVNPSNANSKAHLTILYWVRQLVFIALLILDFKHIYEYVESITRAAQANNPVILFGQWLPGITNGTFDSFAYAAAVTATLYLMSNTWALRMAYRRGAVVTGMAMGVGIGVSALANAATMFLAATGTPLVPDWLLGPTAATVGGIVTLGLFMFATMDAFELRERLEKGRATRAQRKLAREEAARKAKFTPKGKRDILTLPDTRDRRKAMNG